MPSPVVDEVRSAGLDERVSALGARLRLLLGSRPSDGAARMLLDELGELPLAAVEASAQRLIDPVQASGLMRAVTALQCELHDAVVDTHARMFGRINDGLASLATISPAELVERAPVLLCEVCEFDRAMISRVHGSTWAPAAVHMAAGAGDEVNVRLGA